MTLKHTIFYGMIYNHTYIFVPFLIIGYHPTKGQLFEICEDNNCLPLLEGSNYCKISELVQWFPDHIICHSYCGTYLLLSYCNKLQYGVTKYELLRLKAENCCKRKRKVQISNPYLGKLNSESFFCFWCYSFRVSYDTWILYAWIKFSIK